MAVPGLMLHLGQLLAPLCSLLIEAWAAAMPADQGPVTAGVLQGATHRLSSKELPSYRAKTKPNCRWARKIKREESTGQPK